MAEQKTVCEFCGKEKDELSFVIGASNEPDWCMLEGTGKMTCPTCYPAAQEQAQKIINKVFNKI